MKLVKTASGKKTLKISKKEWQNIGKQAGWIKASRLSGYHTNYSISDPDSDILRDYPQYKIKKEDYEYVFPFSEFDVDPEDNHLELGVSIDRENNGIDVALFNGDQYTTRPYDWYDFVSDILNKTVWKELAENEDNRSNAIDDEREDDHKFYDTDFR